MRDCLIYSIFHLGYDEDDEYYYVEENANGDDAVEEIMEDLGDEENLVICDNLERALYLSLKYEFVTPLTSLVVVGPDRVEKEGDLSEASSQNHNRRHTIHLMSGSSSIFRVKELVYFCSFWVAISTRLVFAHFNL